MTGALVAGLLLLSALGSLLWASPSKTERRHAEMRALAMQKGLSLTTLNIADTSERGRIESRRRLVTGYKLRTRGQFRPRLPELTIVRTEGESGYGLPDGWVWHDAAFRLRGAEQQRLLDCIEGLPDWVECLAVLPDGLAIGFEERGGADRVEAVIRLLENRLYEVISSNPV